MSTTEDPGFNCLTNGIHHGRPEAIWNIPLMYAATVVYDRAELKELVIARIYNDAMKYVAAYDTFTQEWADRVKKWAEASYDNTLQTKIGELDRFYKSHSHKFDVAAAIEGVERDKLNPGYAPLHPHDSINQLCRGIGVSASIKASKELNIP